LYKYIFLISIIFATLLSAKGTKAGSLVDNKAKIEYDLNGILLNVNSNTDSFVVDRIVDISTTWQDSSAIKVSAGDKARVLTFLLTNEGNSEDNITLSTLHENNSTFKAQNIKLFEDSNGNGIFDKGSDLEISNLNLNEDANKTIFIVADIPNDNVEPGNESKEELIATSNATASTGDDDKNRIDTVIRTKKDSATGVYSIWEYWLESKKSATIHSEDNTTHTGSKITYKIELSIGGNSSNKKLLNINFADAIPSGTKYLPNSLKLNAHTLTDANDSDQGFFDNNSIKVHINKIENSEKKSIEFDVIVQ